MLADPRPNAADDPAAHFTCAHAETELRRTGAAAASARSSAPWNDCPAASGCKAVYDALKAEPFEVSRFFDRALALADIEVELDTPPDGAEIPKDGPGRVRRIPSASWTV